MPPRDPEFDNYAIYRFGDGAENGLVGVSYVKARSCEDAFNDAAKSSRLGPYIDGSYYGTPPGQDVFVVIPCLKDGRAVNGSGSREPQMFRLRVQEPASLAVPVSPKEVC